MKLILFTVH